MLEALPANIDPKLLVGFDTKDDACVYLVREDLALIKTLDFFPPIVDDPLDFGRVAAANALSDVFAMGAVPTVALNILCIPSCLPAEDVASILAGGAEKVLEAGAVLAGGHSVEDAEPKYGLCVSAFCHPDKIWTNAGAKPGDELILTKPIGNGILATAAKQDKISQEDFQPAIRYMTTLNKHAMEAAHTVAVNACTDITGFGFLGHAFELAEASGVTLRIDSKRVPMLEMALGLAENDVIPGGAGRNEEFLSGKIAFAQDVPPAMKPVLFDPQTSGGLLLSVPSDQKEALLLTMQSKGVDAVCVGNVEKFGEKHIEVS